MRPAPREGGSAAPSSARLAVRAAFGSPRWSRLGAALRARVRRDGRPAQPKPPLRRRMLLWVRWLALAALCLAGLAALAFFFLVLRHHERDLPTTAELKKYDPPQVTRILARDGAVLGEVFTERRTLVGIAEFPPAMRLAALAAEDARFYEHEGLDDFGMLRALLVNLRSGAARQGGSTITQQVVKNVLLTSERTFDLRKESRYNPTGLPPSRFAEVGKVLRVRFLGSPSEGKLRLDLGPQGALVAIDVNTREIPADITCAMWTGFDDATPLGAREARRGGSRTGQ